MEAMTRDDKLKHIRLDPENLKTANRRAKEDYRNNMTAYINALIAEDGKLHPESVERISRGIREYQRAIAMKHRPRPKPRRTP